MTKKDILHILKDVEDEAELYFAICKTPLRISAYAPLSDIVEKNAAPLPMTPKNTISPKNVVLYINGDMNQLIKEQDKV
jgi:hypothetical protein